MDIMEQEALKQALILSFMEWQRNPSDFTRGRFFGQTRMVVDVYKCSMNKKAIQNMINDWFEPFHCEFNVEILE